MTLPAKERFKEKGINVEIMNSEDDAEQCPKKIVCRGRELTVLGVSLEDDLFPDDVPEVVLLSGWARQYVACDNKGNMYELYIYSYVDSGKRHMFIGGAKSIPTK